VGGEDWVMKHCYRGKGKFRLRDYAEKAYVGTNPNQQERYFRVRDVPEIALSPKATGLPSP
jgi:hypothetical protein